MTESGDRLGSHYTLDRILGSGAMGQVWLAHRENGDKVAVKMLHPHLTSDRAIVRRFIEERELLTSIHSPAVVEVFDMVMEGEHLGIVMEYVDGPDLGSELALHAKNHELMQEGYAARLGAEVCDGLSAVHAARICHRDVKPANVLLSQGPDGDWHPKLTDFGVSKILDSTLEGSTAFAGTPNYVAPEIIKGQTPSAASDLYSFGVMLYEMVAGHTPFPALNREAVILAHLDREPPRPTGISDAMWYVISCCLAKDPAHRPVSAASVGTSLRRLVEGLDPGVLVQPAVSGMPPEAPGPLPGGAATQIVGQVGGQGWTSMPPQPAVGGQQLPPGSAPQPSGTPQPGYPSGVYPGAPQSYGSGSYPPGSYSSAPYPSGSVPPGPVPPGSVPPGAYPAGSYPSGAYSPGAPGSYPPGSYPSGSVPPGSAGTSGTSPSGMTLLGLPHSGGAGTQQTAHTESSRPRRRTGLWISVAALALLAVVVIGAIFLDPFGSEPSAGSAQSATATPSGQTSSASGSESSSAQTTSQPTQTVTLPAGAKLCSPKVGVGTENTSCQLAANVAAAIPDNPGDRFTVTAYSPVTGKNYTLTCTSGQYYMCTKSENNIEVYVIK